VVLLSHESIIKVAGPEVKVWGLAIGPRLGLSDTDPDFSFLFCPFYRPPCESSRRGRGGGTSYGGDHREWPLVRQPRILCWCFPACALGAFSDTQVWFTAAMWSC